MTPDEVLAVLKSYGIEMSRATLNRYEKQGLIPTPERGAYGRGGGRWTAYPKETAAHALAAWKLMHGEYGTTELRRFFGEKLPILSPQSIKAIRDANLPTEPITKGKLIKEAQTYGSNQVLMGFSNIWNDLVLSVLIRAS